MNADGMPLSFASKNHKITSSNSTEVPLVPRCDILENFIAVARILSP